MTKTAKELLTTILNGDKDLCEDFMYFSYESEDYKKISEYDLYYKVVDSYGGEDQGSDYWSVIKLKLGGSDEEFLVKFRGWYASYHGADFTDWSFVTPKEKVITIYE